MNLIDNGCKEILKVKRIITEDELCFEITFIDYWNQKRVKKSMKKTIRDWRE